MPMYEYECGACGHRFERIQKFSDPPVEECPSCGERKVQKLLSSPAIQFKGTGWYITDYAKKGSVGTDASKESGKESGKESKESGKESGKESKESSTKSTESTTSSTPTSGTTSTPKASGE
jgi:putative FmdB family regulatory protein